MSKAQLWEVMLVAGEKWPDASADAFLVGTAAGRLEVSVLMIRRESAGRKVDV